MINAFSTGVRVVVDDGQVKYFNRKGYRLTAPNCPRCQKFVDVTKPFHRTRKARYHQSCWESMLIG